MVLFEVSEERLVNGSTRKCQNLFYKLENAFKYMVSTLPKTYTKAIRVKDKHTNKIYEYAVELEFDNYTEDSVNRALSVYYKIKSTKRYEVIQSIEGGKIREDRVLVDDNAKLYMKKEFLILPEAESNTYTNWCELYFKDFYFHLYDLVPDIDIVEGQDTLEEVKRIKLIFNVYLYELEIMDEDEDAIRD
jgi:asparagine N-glycosylation enzyme membrane subunit Stt3